MSSRLWMRAATPFIVSGLGVALLLSLPSQVVDKLQPSHRQRYDIQGEVSQTFNAPEDRLSSVGMYLFLKDSAGPVTARLSLYADEETEPLAIVSRSVQPRLRIPADIYLPVYFDFDPIPASTGRRFRAKLDARSDGLMAMASLGDAYREGNALIDDEPQEFDFSLALRHSGNLRDQVDRVNQWTRPGALYAAVVVSLSLSVLAGIGYVRGRRPFP